MAPVHKHFDTDSNPDLKQPALEAPEPLDDDASDASTASDSDDAPEAISTAAALSTAKSTRARITSSVKEQALTERAKRKQREEKLASQTRSRKSKSAAQDSELEAKTSEDEHESDADADPPLLPLSVLAAAEQSVRLQQQAELRASMRETAIAGPRKRRFEDLDAEAKPIKDKRAGRTAVRVLGKAPGVLPPKASKQTRNIKERMLMGRRGRNGLGSEAGRRARVKGFAGS